MPNRVHALRPSATTTPAAVSGASSPAASASRAPSVAAASAALAPSGLLGLQKLGRSEAAAAEARLLGGSGVSVRAGGKLAVDLGKNDAGKSVGFDAQGRVSVDGKRPEGVEGTSKALMEAARLSSGLAKSGGASDALRKQLLQTCTDGIVVATQGKRSVGKERLFAASMTLLINLAKGASGDVKEKSIDRLIGGLAAQRDIELRLFYYSAILSAQPGISASQRTKLGTFAQALMPTRAPVDLYTQGRTKPLVVRHAIHEEFWKEELTFYSKKDGWTLISKNAKDNKRVYEGEIKDPSGKKAPIKVKVTVEKEELEFLNGMSDEKTHLIIYSGHSSLGGNGSHAVSVAKPMKGHPKLVFMANCRGKDNYAEFMGKFPEAMLITTRDPTYSDHKHRRIQGLYEMLARDESFAWMKKKTSFRLWDEASDNYIFPHELRRLFFLDLDRDGRIDRSPGGNDILFDVDRKKGALDFIRAVNFINSEYFYHWEVDDENGKRSRYGKVYADSVIADGAIRRPKQGEIVRVTPKVSRAGGKKRTLFHVQFNAKAINANRNFYAGVVMANVAMAIAKHRFKKVEPFEAMRAVLMGAQAVHYLDVYADTSPKTYAKYFDYMGMKGLTEAEIEKVFKNFDAHANDAQTKSFAKLVETKTGLALAKYVPTNGGEPVIV